MEQAFLKTILQQAGVRITVAEDSILVRLPKWDKVTAIIREVIQEDK